MNKKILFKEFLLLLTTSIWGIAFVFQNIAGKSIDTFTLNVSRFFIAAVFLFVFDVIVELVKKKKGIVSEKTDYKTLLLGGLATGFALSVATNFQQFGINMEGAGKSGFLTAIYIVFVPIFGLLFKRKTNFMAVIAIAIAVVGLYFINVSDEGFSISKGSLMLLLCAIAYSFQILFVDVFSKKCDGIKLSVSMFVFAGIITLPLMFIFGDTNISEMTSFLPLMSVLFLGIGSSGVAYTLQIVGQKDVNPTIASLIMSFESVFSLIFGMLILKESHTLVQYIGCALIFASVIISQIPLPSKIKVNNNI